MTSLLLDRDTWGPCVDAAGNIAVCDFPYRALQDVATRLRSFKGTVYYDTDAGLPYLQEILGKNVPLAFVQAKMIESALQVDGVIAVEILFSSQDQRTLSGQAKCTLSDGTIAAVAF